MQKKNPHAFFVVRRTKLVKLLRQLRGNVVNKKARYKTVCELTIIDGRISFNAPGATFGMEAQTGGTAKASFDLDMFWRILATYRQKELRVVIEKYKLIIDKFCYPANTAFFEDDTILRSTVLPIDYSELDLLSISTSGKYTIEEMQFNGLWLLVNQAEDRLRNNVNMAARALNIYGITHDDIREFIKIRIQNAIRSMETSLDAQNKVREGTRVPKDKQ